MNKKIISIILYLSILLISCSFLKVDKKDSLRSSESIINIKDYYENNSALIMGKVSASSEIKQPIVIIACSIKPSEITRKYTFNYIILDSPKEFMIYLPDGDYYLYAEADLDNNSIFDENEIIGFYGKPDKISLLKNEINPLSGDSIYAERKNSARCFSGWRLSAF